MPQNQEDFPPAEPAQPIEPAIPPAQPAAPKPAAAPKNLFNNQKFLKRTELREKLRKDTGKIPGAGEYFSKEERVGLEKEVFGKKSGKYITPVEFKKGLKILGKQKFAARTTAEKTQIDRKLRFLKKISGGK